MSIKYINLLNNTFNYDSLFNEQNNLNSLKGGTINSYDKYILLSCHEFNYVVDEIISQDIQNNRILSINNSQNANASQFNISTSDTNIDVTQGNITEITQFLKDIIIDFDDVVKTTTILELINIPKYKELFARSKNNYETANFFRGFINWATYPDKTPDIKMNANTVKKLKGAKIIFFAYFSFNELNATPIIDQLLFLNSLNHYGVDEINIVLPYFPVGTMERIVGEGEIPTGYALAQMINSIPSGSSKNKIYIFDIHALCSRFFFHTNTIPILITLMPKYLDYIESEYPTSNNTVVLQQQSNSRPTSSSRTITRLNEAIALSNEAITQSNLNIIVFPDDGAKKRFAKLLPKDTKTITCSKTRQGTTRIIKIDEGLEHLEKITSSTSLVNNINLFIIDDLVQSGGTLIKTIEGIQTQIKDTYPTLTDKVKYFTLVTHSILPNADTKFLDYKNITKIITSDTRPLKIKEITKHLQDANNTSKLEVMKISDVIYKIFTSNEEKYNYIAPYSIK